MTGQTIYREHLSEPWYTLVSLGLKTCEGRLHKNRFRKFKKGDIIMWVNDDFGKERFCFTKITYVKVYKTFEEFLNDKGLEKCLPGMPNLEHGLGVYKKYHRDVLNRGYPTKPYLKEKSDEERYNVVSFELEKVNYSITLIFNGIPNEISYVKTIDEAYQLLSELNENNEYGWKIDNTHITFENGSLYMLKEKFCDIDFILRDLNILNSTTLKSVGDCKTFTTIQTTYDKKKEEEEVAKMVVESNEVYDKILASGKSKLMSCHGRL